MDHIRFYGLLIMWHGALSDAVPRIGQAPGIYAEGLGHESDKLMTLL